MLKIPPILPGVLIHVLALDSYLLNNNNIHYLYSAFLLVIKSALQSVNT